MTGFLVEPRDADGLAEKLDLLIRTPRLRAELGERAQQRIDERFSIRTNVEATERIYGHVLHGA